MTRGADDRCSLARAAELLGMSRPSVVRRKDELRGSKNERNEWVFSLGAVLREREKILRRLNAVEPDAHAVKIAELNERINVLHALRENERQREQLEARLVRTYEVPAGPDTVIDHRA